MSALFGPTALVVPFENLRMGDVESVGGKNASLGEMIAHLPSGVNVPTTAGGVHRDLPFHLATSLCNGSQRVLDVFPHPADLPGGEQHVDPSPGSVPVGDIAPWASHSRSVTYPIDQLP